jgi:hypothetical protein
MVAPLVGLAVGAAARAVAKKVASNAAKKTATNTVSRIDRSKIVKGSDVAKAIKKVNVKTAKAEAKTAKVEAKANARGLRAANKPTNKIGSKADKEIRSRTKSVSTSKEEAKAIYDYRYGKGSGEGITQINKRVVPKNEASSVRKTAAKPGTKRK